MIGVFGGTGFYRFLDDDAGAVLAEDRAPDVPSFLNHHFPGSDIPAQARALYVRNLVRAIPDVTYRPAPLTPAAPFDVRRSTRSRRSSSPGLSGTSSACATKSAAIVR